MTVKAVFYCSKITHHATSRPEDTTAVVELAAAFGGYLKGLPGGDEMNKDWSKYTPQGKVEITITNPSALEQFKPGGVYSLTFEELEVTPAKG